MMRRAILASRSLPTRGIVRLPMWSLAPHRSLCDAAKRAEAVEAAKHAIAAAERAAGELDAAERAAAAESSDRPPVAAEAVAAARTPLRFPIGAAVECRLGEARWARGTIVGHHYREPSWPADRVAPYQVRLEDGRSKATLIYAPADMDDCVRSALRFAVGASVECNLGDGEWARGTVVAQFHREPSWPKGQWAPYQVEVQTQSDGRDATSLIFAPVDEDECIRASRGWPWPGYGKEPGAGPVIR